MVMIVIIVVVVVVVVMVVIIMIVVVMVVIRMAMTVTVSMVVIMRVTVVHERRYAINQQRTQADQQQLRCRVAQGAALVHLRNQIGNRDVQKA